MNHQNSMTVSKFFDISSAIRSLLCPEPTNGRRHGICQVSWSTTSSALWRRYLPKVAEEVRGLLCSSVLTTPPVLRWIDRVIWSLENICMPIGTIVVGYKTSLPASSSKSHQFKKGAAKHPSHLFISFPESSVGNFCTACRVPSSIHSQCWRRSTGPVQRYHQDTKIAWLRE